AIRHPRVNLRHHAGPAKTSEEHVGVNGRLAAWITAKVGSMWTVYICVAITAGWMLLGSPGLLGVDTYPYPFLLFLGYVVQLLLFFIILLGQQVLGRTADRRAMQTYQDAEAILHDCEQIQNHLIAQDTHLADCVTLDAQEQRSFAQAAKRLEQP